VQDRCSAVGLRALNYFEPVIVFNIFYLFSFVFFNFTTINEINRIVCRNNQIIIIQMQSINIIGGDPFAGSPTDTL
jgi:hypothetical protein